MCHLAGYVGRAKPNDVLVSLECQEIYLGGQATGLVWKGPSGGLSVRKVVGPVSNFRDRWTQETAASVCVGHSRFTTKALVFPETNTAAKAHPFIACDESFSLSHNGDITNAESLRRNLTREHFFTSDAEGDFTDSEVIIHLLEEALSQSKGDFQQAIEHVCSLLDGYYLLVIMESGKERVLLANWTQPLEIGAGPEGCCFSSLPEGLIAFPETLRRWHFRPPWNSLVELRDSSPTIQPLLPNRSVPRLLGFRQEGAERYVYDLICKYQPVSFPVLRLLPPYQDMPDLEHLMKLREKAEKDRITITGTIADSIRRLKKKGEIQEDIECVPEAGCSKVPRAVFRVTPQGHREPGTGEKTN